MLQHLKNLRGGLSRETCRNFVPSRIVAQLSPTDKSRHELVYVPQ